MFNVLSKTSIDIAKWNSHCMILLKFFISIKPNQTVEASRFCPASDSQIIFRCLWKQITSRSPWTLKHEMIGNNQVLFNNKTGSWATHVGCKARTWFRSANNKPIKVRSIYSNSIYTDSIYIQDFNLRFQFEKKWQGGCL